MRYPSLSGALGGLQGGRRFEFATSNRRQRPGWRGRRGMDGAVFRGVRRDSAPGQRTALLTRLMGHFGPVGITSVLRRYRIGARIGAGAGLTGRALLRGARPLFFDRRKRGGRDRAVRGLDACAPADGTPPVCPETLTYPLATGRAAPVEPGVPLNGLGRPKKGVMSSQRRRLQPSIGQDRDCGIFLSSANAAGRPLATGGGRSFARRV